MQEILCFGDSNTWGYDPVTGGDSRAMSAGPACCRPPSARASG